MIGSRRHKISVQPFGEHKVTSGIWRRVKVCFEKFDFSKRLNT